MTKNKKIQDNVEMKPKYTSCSSSPHPLVRIHLSAVVACVNGKQYDIYLNMTGIPSIGQMTPLNNNVG